MENTNDRLVLEALRQIMSSNSEKLIREDDAVNDVFVGDIEVKNETDEDTEKEEQEEEVEVTMEEVTELLSKLPKEKLKDVCDFIKTLEIKKDADEEGSSIEHEASETEEEEELEHKDEEKE